MTDKLCDQCGHPFDPHIVWASNTGDPLDGGHMTCPVEGCECFSTWDVRRDAER